MIHELQVRLFRMRLMHRQDFLDGNVLGFITGLAAALLTATRITPWSLGLLLPLAATASMILWAYHSAQDWENQVAFQQRRARLVGALIIAYPLFFTLTLIATVWKGVLPGLSLLN